MSRLVLILPLLFTACSSTPQNTSHQNPQAFALIQELASKCKPRLKDQEWDGTFGISSRTENDPCKIDGKRVNKAYEELKSMSRSAFDELIACSEDNRYSYSAIYAAWRNHSVGDACFFILQDHIDFYGYGYKSRDGLNGKHHKKPEYMYHILNTEGLKKWWKDKKHLSLTELQRESLLWTIDQETQLGFTSYEQRVQILSPLESRLIELDQPSNLNAIENN